MSDPMRHSDNLHCTAEFVHMPDERREMLRQAASELARLRLTDEELKAVRTAAFAYAQNDDDPQCAETAARLLAVAERMSQ